MSDTLQDQYPVRDAWTWSKTPKAELRASSSSTCRAP